MFEVRFGSRVLFGILEGIYSLEGVRRFAGLYEFVPLRPDVFAVIGADGEVGGGFREFESFAGAGRLS